MKSLAKQFSLAFILILFVLVLALLISRNSQEVTNSSESVYRQQCEAVGVALQQGVEEGEFWLYIKLRVSPQEYAMATRLIRRNDGEGYETKDVDILPFESELSFERHVENGGIESWVSLNGESVTIQITGTRLPTVEFWIESLCWHYKRSIQRK